MNRFDRPPFNLADLKNQPNDDARNHLLFDWWCDEGDLCEPGQVGRPSDRLSFIATLRGVPTEIPSRSPLQLDPAPPVNRKPKLGLRNIVLLSHPSDIRRALTDKDFSNQPYAALGGASFLLGLDPPLPGCKEPDWHGMQAEMIQQAFRHYPSGWLRRLADLAVEQAALTSLARSEFDLAEWAEQAGLRYMAMLFGYGFQDHPLLQDAARATYRALQYLAVGQHFTTEPGTLPAAQQALGHLVDRTSDLMDDYLRLARSPKRYGPVNMRTWPHGVQPWSELGLSPLGGPVLKRLTGVPPSPVNSVALSGKDRATVAATLIAGTLGNIQTAVCLLVKSALLEPSAQRLKDIKEANCHGTLGTLLESWMGEMPPVPVLPRRSRATVRLSNGVSYPSGTDFLVLLEGAAPTGHPSVPGACPRIWGGIAHPSTRPVPIPPAPHACLGRELALPLIASLVSQVVGLKGIKSALDPLTGQTLSVERLWGFAATRYPLRYDREEVRPQQNLIVAMPVKPPISENAMHLRRLIAAGVPRIEHVLTTFGHVHMAWFEFTEGDRNLVLRTVYDGAFEPYLEHFALYAGDLFDGLFEFLEGAPPRPVCEHPREFVEVLRQFNRGPLAGYLYSAYPRTKADWIRQYEGGL